MPSKHPLDWPESWPRTPWNLQKDSRFKKHTFGVMSDELTAELDRFGADHVVLSTDISLTRLGTPRYNAGEPDDSGVAVYYQWRGKPFVVACDQYHRCWENIRAITKTIEAMRAIERHGASSLLERAVSGFSALPPASGPIAPEPPKPPWWEVLAVDLSPWGTTPEELANDSRHPMRAPILRLVELMWKQRVKAAHPDLGGSTEEMTSLNIAIADARSALGKVQPDD